MLPRPGALRAPAFLSSLSLLSLLAACAPTDPGGELRVDCGGKCDGFDSIRSLLRDPADLELDDLVELGTPYATREVNDLLALSPYADLSIAETKTFDAAQVDELVAGLAARFGESALTTEVNELRRRHLERSGDEVYAEAAFRMAATLQHSFSFPVPWIDGSDVSLGFDGTTPIEARVVSAFPSVTHAVLEGPLAAAREIRGFVLPRGLDDIRAMQPGESIGLNAHGHVAVNLGVGVPILVAHPANWASYTLVFSAGLRTRLEGDLDVQLVRMDGGEVVIDVGIERASVASERLAVEDRWGVQGLLDFDVDVAGFNLDLGRLAEHALESKLNSRVGLLSARLEHSNLNLRMSVARLRFDLDQGNPELLSAAIAQALRGDVRLGQALSNRGEPGVVAEFDLLRSGASSSSFAGIDVFGLRFFSEMLKSEGSVVLQTPGGARTILFDSLHRAGGWFLSSHGYTRVALSGLVFPSDPTRDPRSEANLFFQVEEGDGAMERDKLVDHLDGLILGLGGQPALAAIEASGNQLERLVEETCAGSEAFDPCPIDMLGDPRALDLRERGLQALDDQVQNLDPGIRDLAHQAGELRLLAQAVYEQKAQFTGPGTSIVVDYRLDDGALADLMQPGNGARFDSAIAAYLAAVGSTRTDSEADIARERDDIAAATARGRFQMAQTLEDYGSRYRKLVDVEHSAIETLGPIGARAIALRFPVDAQSRPIYEQATADSIVHQRAELAAKLVDALVDEAGAFDPHAEQTVAYGLLGMTDPERLDLRLDLKMELDDGAFFWREPYRQAGYPENLDLYRRGDQVQPIDGGLFSVDSLIDISE